MQNTLHLHYRIRLVKAYLVEYHLFMSTPLVTRSNAAVCGRSLSGIVGFSPAGA